MDTDGHPSGDNNNEYVLSWYSVSAPTVPILQITTPITGTCVNSLDNAARYDCP